MKSAIGKKGKTRWLGRAVLLLGGSLLGFELALQLTSVFMPERVSGFPEGAKVGSCASATRTHGAAASLATRAIRPSSSASSTSGVRASTGC